MLEVKISSKYQIVIPREIRKKLNLKKGQEMIFIEKGGILHLIPSYSLDDLRGCLKGMSGDALREEEERI